jgi:ligand-binding sensor domain-containing protein
MIYFKNIKFNRIQFANFKNISIVFQSFFILDLKWRLIKELGFTKFRFLKLIFILSLTHGLGFSQIPIGSWRDHLPYADCRNITMAKNKIYCSTAIGLFTYNLEDNSLERLSKITGFSDMGISAIKYNPSNDVLLIAYEDANIDLYTGNSIYNFADIKRKSIQGGKSINNILFIGTNAYLSCDFGIVVFDTQKREFSDTYHIGEAGQLTKVNEIAFDGKNLFAATDVGIFFADIKNPNLVDYNNWKRISFIPNFNQSFNTVLSFNNQVLVNYVNTINKGIIYCISGNTYKILEVPDVIKNTICNDEKLVILTQNHIYIYNKNLEKIADLTDYGFSRVNPEDAIIDAAGLLWIADNSSGLVRQNADNKFTNTIINGPYHYNVTDISISGGKLWAAGGIKSTEYRYYGIYSFINNWWENYNRLFIPDMNIPNIHKIVIDPIDPTHVFAGSYGYGLLEFKDQKLIKIYNEKNSILRNIQGFDQGYVRIGGMAFDKANNLWITTSEVSDPVYVKKTDGTWLNMKFKSSGFSFNQANDQIIITQNDHKWMIMNHSGIFAFDNGGNEKKFSPADENGKILTNEVFCLAEDNAGAIWIGTEIGIMVYYNPENVFSGSSFYASRPIIEIDGTSQYVLKTEKITKIVVDGGNRKWIGTESSGVFLLSEDGTTEIFHFTVENSPLLSNNITAISIDNQTGEVFFGTDKGIISYMSNSTQAKEAFDDVYVYPNPVRETYKGDIVITGWVEKTSVKITDINGNLVYQSTSFGGQAIWNGTTLNGRRVNTGVYLVFLSNQDGSETFVTKLLFIN